MLIARFGIPNGRFLFSAFHYTVFSFLFRRFGQIGSDRAAILVISAPIKINLVLPFPLVC